MVAYKLPLVKTSRLVSWNQQSSRTHFKKSKCTAEPWGTIISVTRRTIMTPISPTYIWSLFTTNNLQGNSSSPWMSSVNIILTHYCTKWMPYKQQIPTYPTQKLLNSHNAWLLPLTFSLNWVSSPAFKHSHSHQSNQKQTTDQQILDDARVTSATNTKPDSTSSWS